MAKNKNTYREITPLRAHNGWMVKVGFVGTNTFTRIFCKTKFGARREARKLERFYEGMI